MKSDKFNRVQVINYNVFYTTEELLKKIKGSRKGELIIFDEASF